MPSTTKRESALIRLFVSAYENGTWAADDLEIPDEKFDGGVDGFITRASDGCTLAIEHTLIQPHMDDRKDFALFERYLLPIEKDPTFAVPGRITWIYVKSGTLQPGSNFSSMAMALRTWLTRNVKSLPLGESSYKCPGGNGSGQKIQILTKVYEDPAFSGALAVRRFFGDNTLDQVIDKALDEKLPKLVSAIAEKRVLLLECEQMMLSERTICERIEARASSHPELTKIDIWFAETVFYSTDGAVDFKRYEDNKVVESLMFFRNRLKMKSDYGFATIVERI